MILDGRDMTRMGPTRRARRGLARTFQRLELFSMLSVRDNVRVGVESRRNWAHDGGRSSDATEELIERVGLQELADERVDALPTGQARLVELARALAIRPSVLQLDEPASGQDDRETGPSARCLAPSPRRAWPCSWWSTTWAGHAGLRQDSTSSTSAASSRAAPPTRSATTRRCSPPTWAPASGSGRDGGHGRGPDPRADAGRRSEGFRRRGEPPRARAVRAAYDSIDVLFGVDLAVPRGSVMALLGPNGAGKTTTLLIASGLHQPSSGDVVIAGRRINGAGPAELARAGVCLIPEGRGIFPNLTVRENLRMMTYAGCRLAEVEEEAYLRFPRLKERRRQTAGTLSGGEQQMLAMARGLATHQPLCFSLDELSMGLAPIIVEELYALVAQIARSGISILVVEQFAGVVLGVADRAAVMVQRPGQPQRATPAELETALSGAYLGGVGLYRDARRGVPSHQPGEPSVRPAPSCGYRRHDVQRGTSRAFKEEIAALKVRDPATGRDRMWPGARRAPDGGGAPGPPSPRTRTRTAPRTTSSSATPSRWRWAA